MKKYFLIILFLIISINKTTCNSLKSLKKLEEQNNCNLYKDCFNCSVCGGEIIENFDECPCYWNFDSCEEKKNNDYKTEFWRDHFSNCTDLNSSSIQKKYCGDFTFSKDRTKAEITLPQINDTYGLSNLYCYYLFENTQGKETVYKLKIDLNEKFKKSEEIILLSYKVYYTDDHFDSNLFSMNSGSSSFDNVQKIEIFYYCNGTYEELPFSFEISYKKNPKKSSLKITIVIIFLIIIICIVIIIYVINRIKKSSRSVNSNFARVYDIQISENIINENKKKIEILLNDSKLLGERISMKQFEKYGSNCSICLEEFKVGVDKVSLTPCFHVFHYNCISEWLKKNVTKITCPNCNYDMSNIDKYFININKNQNNENLNNDNSSLREKNVNINPNQNQKN